MISPVPAAFPEGNTVLLAITSSGQSITTGGRNIYWNSAPNEEVIIPHPTSNYTPSSNFKVSIPVKKNDVVSITFSGSVFGNTYMGQILVSGAGGGFRYISPYQGGAFGWSAHHMVYRPYSQRAFYQAPADGTLVFYQEFIQADLNKNGLDYPVRLSGRVAIAEVIKGSTINSGTSY